MVGQGCLEFGGNVVLHVLGVHVWLDDWLVDMVIRHKGINLIL
jgi:hypothetical protein